MSPAAEPTLSCNGLRVTVAGRVLVDDLGFDLTGGEFVAVLGRNGVGKSLTLHTLAGLRAAAAGTVHINGHPVTGKRDYVARHLALLPQYTEDVFPSTVLDTALIGRHPHIAHFHWESERDRHIAVESLQRMDLGQMTARDVTSLSGGERRRLAIAQVMTQAPQVYLLDEPTNHLDPQHQLEVLDVFVQLARDGAAVMTTLHDVNLAARYADRCLLLFGDGRWELNRTGEVLSEERLSDLYNTNFDSVAWRGRQLFVAGSAR